MNKKINKSFNVMADIKLSVVINIDAANLEDALTKARTLTPEDFVEVNGDLTDVERTITGVFE